MNIMIKKPRQILNLRADQVKQSSRDSPKHFVNIIKSKEHIVGGENCGLIYPSYHLLLSNQVSDRWVEYTPCEAMVSRRIKPRRSVNELPG